MKRGDGAIRQLVEDIPKALVDMPEKVNVHGEQLTILELRVAPGDLGKVIGREGRLAHSIRTILDAAGGKLDRRFVLEIMK